MRKSISVLVTAAALALPAVPAWAQQSQISRETLTIDRECASLQKAAYATPPVRLVQDNGTWRVASSADVTAAQQSKRSVALANAWKQADRYAIVTIDSFDASGAQTAVQLCYRVQTDGTGTLARAREANDVGMVDGATAQEAYYGLDGAMIYQNKLFDPKDPLLFKTVESLPFYDVLPK
ncbi:MAG TPA: hypothetical protein VFN49_10615 [Candidatus Aquilonibacter sp.]|nr:hypothetical protein [Candidatus Aquilonibacter sp.]